MAVITRRIFIELEVLGDGSRSYLARDLDHDGLMADGLTPDAAAASLEEARAMRDAHLASRAAGVVKDPAALNAEELSLAWPHEGAPAASTGYTALMR